jgi:hypothetical protein
VQDLCSDETLHGGNLPVSSKNPINKAASIRQKLLNHAKANGQEFQRTIDAYAIECILDRLACSEYADRFLLKGALLFAVWKGLGKRPTRDLDLLGKGANDIDTMIQIFKKIVLIDNKVDCVIFEPERIEGMRIKEDDDYEGVRVLVSGSLCGARFKVQIDIGFGDAVTPSAVYSIFPRILDMRPFSMLMYPPETVFAEKLDAIVLRGMMNSRMKDYYDLSILIHENLVQVKSVRLAVINTFARRKTIMPQSCPIGLSDQFAQEATKIAQWKGFLKKSGLNAETLSDVIASIREFVAKVFEVQW